MAAKSGIHVGTLQKLQCSRFLPSLPFCTSSSDNGAHPCCVLAWDAADSASWLQGWDLTQTWPMRWCHSSQTPWLVQWWAHRPKLADGRLPWNFGELSACPLFSRLANWCVEGTLGNVSGCFGCYRQSACPRMKPIAQENRIKRGRVESWRYILDPWIQPYLKQARNSSGLLSCMSQSVPFFSHSKTNIWAQGKCLVLYWALWKQQGWKQTSLSSSGAYRLIKRAFPPAMNLTGVCQLDLCKKCEGHNRRCLREQFYGKWRDNLYVNILSTDAQQKPRTEC